MCDIVNIRIRVSTHQSVAIFTVFDIIQLINIQDIGVPFPSHVSQDCRVIRADIQGGGIASVLATHGDIRQGLVDADIVDGIVSSI